LNKKQLKKDKEKVFWLATFSFFLAVGIASP